MKKVIMGCVLLFATTLFAPLNANDCYSKQSSKDATVTVWVGNDGNIYGTNKNNTRCDVAINIKYDDGSWSGKRWCSMNANTRNNFIFNAGGTAACFYIVEIIVQPN